MGGGTSLFGLNRFDCPLSGRELEKAGIGVDGLLEAGVAVLFDPAEGEEDGSRFRDGHQGDYEGAELFGAGAVLEGVKIALGRARAGPAAATGRPYSHATLRRAIRESPLHGTNDSRGGP